MTANLDPRLPQAFLDIVRERPMDPEPYDQQQAKLTMLKQFDGPWGIHLRSTQYKGEPGPVLHNMDCKHARKPEGWITGLTTREVLAIKQLDHE